MPKGEQAVEAILTAAEALFLQQGYNGTSMRDIAQKAGYKSVAGLYNHFEDKEKILIALLNARSPYPHMVKLMDSIPGDTVAEFFPHFFRVATDFMLQHIIFIKLALLDFIEFNAVHIQQLLEQQTLFPVALKRLQSLEGWQKDMPPIVIIRVIGMQLFGYIVTQGLLPAFFIQSLPEEAWKENIINVLLHGLGEHHE